MTVYTKTAEEVFAPTNADGSQRGPRPQDAQLWGTEIQKAIADGDSENSVRIAEVANTQVAIAAEVDEAQASINQLEADVDTLETLVASGLVNKDPVRIVITSNISIAALDAGDVLDGITLIAGDRVLLVGQTTASQNGVYIIQTASAAIRATDLDTSAELLNAAVFVEAGTVGTGRTYKMTTPAPITVGTTALVWTLISKVQPVSGDAALTSASFPDNSSIQRSIVSGDQPFTNGDTSKQMVEQAERGDMYLAFAGPSVEFGLIRQLDIATVAKAQHIQSRRHNVRIFRCTTSEIAMVGYGQSLMVGQQSWPVFTGWTIDNSNYSLSAPNNPVPHTWMVGNSSWGNGNGFTIIGTAVLNPLAAAVIDPADRTRVLTASEIKNLVEPTDAHYGESPLLTLTTGAALAWNNGERIDREFTALNAANSNSEWDILKPGQALYARLEAAVNTRWKPLAVARSGAGQQAVGCFWLMGGQFNYPGHSGATDEATNLTNLAAIRTDFNSNLATWLGQTVPPACFVTVPDAQYVRDDGDMGIATATLKFAFRTPGVWCTGGHYSVPDKSGHLDPNGSRQLGDKAAQVWKHVVIDGLDWRPVYPVWMLEVNQTLYVGFHAPVYPLRLDKVPSAYQNLFHDYGKIPPQLLRNKGFTLVDDSGTVPLRRDPYLAGASVLALPMARARSGTMYLWAGRYIAITEGMTLLCDSDGTRADDEYRYVSPPMFSDQNIPALVNKPYDMANWAVVGRWQCPTVTGVQTFIDYGE